MEGSGRGKFAISHRSGMMWLCRVRLKEEILRDKHQALGCPNNMFISSPKLRCPKLKRSRTLKRTVEFLTLIGSLKILISYLLCARY